MPNAEEVKTSETTVDVFSSKMNAAFLGGQLLQASVRPSNTTKAFSSVPFFYLFYNDDHDRPIDIHHTPLPLNTLNLYDTIFTTV